MAEDEVRDPDCHREESKPPKWLVMIYLAGDNSLSANCIAILQELEAACPPEDVRVVACFDANTPRPRGARYLEINYRRRHFDHADIDWDLHNDLVPFKCLPGHPVEAPDFCNADPTSVQPTTEPVAKEGLSRFIRFALRHHRAEKNMLILFGHGSAVAGNTFLADNNPPSFLRLKELRAVLTRHFEARPSSTQNAEDEEPEVDESEEFEPEEEEFEFEGEGQESGEGGEKSKRPVLNILACDNCMMSGIESAFEIRKRVDYIIGSQGLMLALGWPFRKIIEEVIHNQDEEPEFVAERILRVCARNLLDFALMDRSSEQSLCDLTKLRKKSNLVKAIRRLSSAMQRGLALDRCGDVKHPAVRDAIRLARLEAQSYWAETFVDLYDFCALLLERSTAALSQFFELYKQTRFAVREGGARDPEALGADIDPRELSPFKEFGDIASACWEVLEAIRANQEEAGGERRGFVLDSYYVGPELQYSNGVSVYFPWTLPEAPIIFEPEDGSGGGLYNVSWARLDRIRQQIEKRVRAELASASAESKPPTEFKFVTAFDEYQRYDFARKRGGDWAAFLRAFFKATLRDVRRFDLKYSPAVDRVDRFFDIESLPEDLPAPFDRSPIDLQKSSSDVDSESDCACPTIKNYPRRFYVSPADCLRRCDRERHDEGCHENLDPVDKEICVSYLGWNVRGIVAEVIKPKEDGRDSCDAPEDASGGGGKKA